MRRAGARLFRRRRGVTGDIVDGDGTAERGEPQLALLEQSRWLRNFPNAPFIDVDE